MGCVRGPRVLKGLDTQGLEALINYLDFYSKGNGKTATKCTSTAREKESKDENGGPDAVQPGRERSLGGGEVRMKQKRQFYQQDEQGGEKHLQPANV